MAIVLSDALDQMEILSPDTPFSISFCTYDKKKDRGGEIIRLKNVIRTGQAHNMKANKTIGVRNPRNSHHPYAVHQHLITTFNGQNVIL